ncbi:PAAR domain-containing protein [Endozoicomonas lisbonensis]|uniref:Zn-binding protein involved in type VI secretion n=1 Tax=Endozoicomonas lisbonensis TaxID=3120522 RepID=A0ABV2SAS9_9GAMM
MGMPAARVTDMHVCPMTNPGPVPHVGGPISVAGGATVLIANLPSATVGSACVCSGPPDSIAMGSTTVMFCGKPAARLGDTTSHGGKVVAGAPTVLIG